VITVILCVICFYWGVRVGKKQVLKTLGLTDQDLKDKEQEQATVLDQSCEERGFVHTAGSFCSNCGRTW
jgi:uncharacterized membrane protein